MSMKSSRRWQEACMGEQVSKELLTKLVHRKKGTRGRSRVRWPRQ